MKIGIAMCVTLSIAFIALFLGFSFQGKYPIVTFICGGGSMAFALFGYWLLTKPKKN
jgi:hypothetical protein